jgi:polyisoprenoid-binding protein YceI
MRSRPVLLTLLAVLLLVVGGGAAAWALFLRGDDVAPLSLPSQAPATSSDPAASTGTAAASGATSSLPQPSAATLDAASLPGTWSIAPDSVVGYRVREKLASLSAESDAVGRTSSITGSATIVSSGGTLSVTAAEFTVDMTTIASDRRMRDNRLRTDGIQTDSFPTSTFKLTSPIAIPSNAVTGAEFDATLHGDLTLHGVTRTVDLPARAQVNGSLIQVLGTLTFPFSDFGINAPNIGGFVSVQDQGTLEFQVNLAKS